MIQTFLELRSRNEVLFHFGWICFALAMIFLVFSRISTVQVYNVSAWYKPIKFALSIGIFSWTMGWYTHYLTNFNSNLFGWTTVVLLGFEIIYIAIQAARGELSHYNVSSAFYSAMYVLMALAATGVTLYTAYIGWLFCTQSFPDLPAHYLWAIRLGIALFVVFSFEGFVMGSRMSHTIGGPDGGSGLPFLNWSKSFGDPRVSHFIGMHALQVLPFLSYYLLKNVKATIFIGALYALLAVVTLIQALNGRPMIRENSPTSVLTNSPGESDGS